MFRNVNIIDMRGWELHSNELYNAALNGEVDIIKDLLSRKANINCRNGANNGWSPLHAAASNGHTDAVLLLIKRGASVNAQDNSGNTALHIAAHNGHTAVVKALIDNNADVTILNGANHDVFLCIENRGIQNSLGNLLIGARAKVRY